jgi:RNA polymerase sigma-70 factor (ECF subfamily)
VVAQGAEADPAVEVDRRWTSSVVRASLAELPEAERHVLVLAYDEDLSQSQIAVRLGLPIGTVKSRTRRAMAVLRARLVEIPELMDR